MKQTFYLVNPIVQLNAAKFIQGLPTDSERPLMVIVQPKTRKLEQNAKMWAMLAEVAAQVVWHGRKLTAEEWKWIFSASLKKQEAVPGLDGGFVILGQSTSDMTVGEMADMITLIHAFGAQNDVAFKD